jgi:D-3-phosphoglycerate dehydrogenase
LNSETHHLISGRELDLMKTDAVLINTARGGLIETDALIDRLKAERIRGAGLDVIENEPPPQDHPIFGLKQVLITPHSAFYSEQAFQQLWASVVAEVLTALRGGTPRNAVNLPEGEARAVAR